MIKNFNNNFIDTNSEEIILNENENRSLTLTNDFEYLSFDNSMNHVIIINFMFLRNSVIKCTQIRDVKELTDRDDNMVFFCLIKKKYFFWEILGR
jgi:hypothetical protein